MANVKVASREALRIAACLGPIYLVAGNVNALAEALNDSAPPGTRRIHPNRLRALLSRDEDIGLHEGTLEAIQKAVEAYRERYPDIARRAAREIERLRAQAGMSKHPFADLLLPVVVAEAVRREPGPAELEPRAGRSPQEEASRRREAFVRVCYNERVIRATMRDAVMVARVPIPGGGYEAFSLNRAQTELFEAELRKLAARLRGVDPFERPGVLASYVATAEWSVEPLLSPRLMMRLEYFLPPHDFDNYALYLR